jgi:hypothetical protein
MAHTVPVSALPARPTLTTPFSMRARNNPLRVPISTPAGKSRTADTLAVLTLLSDSTATMPLTGRARNQPLQSGSGPRCPETPGTRPVSTAALAFMVQAMPSCARPICAQAIVSATTARQQRPHRSHLRAAVVANAGKITVASTQILPTACVVQERTMAFLTSLFQQRAIVFFRRRSGEPIGSAARALLGAGRQFAGLWSAVRHT